MILLVAPSLDVAKFKGVAKTSLELTKRLNYDEIFVVYRTFSSGSFKVTPEYLLSYLQKYVEIKEGMKIVSVDKYLPADIKYDLDIIPWKFAKPNSYDIIFASHFLEHSSDMVSTMKEIHRVLRPGGILFLRLPHFKHKGAFCDPTHKHFISWETLECFEKITSFIQISVFTLKYLKGSLSAMIGRENL